MIVRSWRGSVAKKDRDRYFDYLKQTGLIAYQHTPGNRGVLALRRDLEDRTEFLLITFWESEEAVKRFAGPDPSRAIFYPADQDMLVEFDSFANHYELLHHYVDF